jgi:hypothetical protein
MTTELRHYVAAGYFLSRWTGEHDCTGVELRRVSLGSTSRRACAPPPWPKVARSWDTRFLIPEFGARFNSPESRHLDEVAAYRGDAVAPNPAGLVDSFADALALCRQLDTHAADTQHKITGWLPWLIVRYPP